MVRFRNLPGSNAYRQAGAGTDSSHIDLRLEVNVQRLARRKLELSFSVP